MRERRSRSFAHAEPGALRPDRLASPLLIGGLGLTLAALLLAFHPAQHYTRLLQSAGLDDPLTSQLAQGMLTEQPDQRQLYPTLIRAELRRSRFAQAEDLARQWRTQARSSDEQTQAYALQFEALSQAWFAQPPGTPAREQQAVPLRRFLSDTAPERAHLPLQQTLAMAEVAQQLLGAAALPPWLPKPPPAQASADERLHAARLLQQAGDPLSAFAWLTPLQPRLHRLDAQQAAQFVSAAVQARRLDVLAQYTGLRLRQTRHAAQAAALLRGFVLAAQRMNRLPDALPLLDGWLALHPALAQDRSLLLELVQAARAARRPDLAAHWASRLLQWRDAAPRAKAPAPLHAPHRSHAARTRNAHWLTQQGHRWLAALAQRWSAPLGHTALRWLAQAGAAAPDAVSPPRARRTASARSAGFALPFEEQAYGLAYQAFIDNRDLAQAWRVARAAVDARPADARWRQRLAEVSEWSGRSQDALDQWRWLAQQRDLPAAWQGILRLAPGLLQWDALLLAYERRARLQPTAEHLRQLIDLLRRLGESERALALLQQQVRTQPQPWSLDLLAQLQTELGQSEAAIATWRQLQRLQPLDARQAMGLTSRLIVRGELAQALEVQEQAPLPEAAEDRHDVLNMRLELARLLGRADSARRSHAALEQAQLLQAQDTDTFYALLERQAPREAGQLAARSWQRWQRPTDLQRALYQLVDARDWTTLDRLLAEPAAQALTQTRSDWLLLLAQAEQLRQRPARARAALARALTLAPDDTAVQEASLWSLIDAGPSGALRQRLAQWEAALARDPRQHNLLAAAHLNLSQPSLALQRYLLPQARQRQDDPLWAMTLADALEQNGQTDAAWAWRQRIWHQLQARQASAPAQPPVALQDLARERLALAALPGDASLALLRELLREDAAAGTERSTQLPLLVGAWLQEQGQLDAARAWYAGRAAQSLSRPVWIEVAAALETDDAAQLGQLLESDPLNLALTDRVQAWQRVGDVPAAQTEAFEGVEQGHDSEALQDALQTVLLAHSRQLSLGHERRQDRVLRSDTTTVGASLPWGPRLQLSLQLDQTRHTVRDLTALAHGGSARSLVVSAQWSQPSSSQRLSLGQHEGWDQPQRLSWQHLAWQQQGPLDRHTRYDLRAAWREPSTLGPALRLAGRQHSLALGLQHTLSGRDELALGLDWQSFETQAGDALGRGHSAQLRYTHWWRRAAPDLGLDLFAQHSRYRFADRAVSPMFNGLAPAGSALPVRSGLFAAGGSSERGLRLHSNLAWAERHTRRWQPYGSLTLVHNSSTGWRQDLELGLAGQWLGQDHVQFYWRRSGSGNPQTETTQQFGFDQRIHF